ncbi:MAG: hypothetical protein H6636_10330 [Anaerolineales bacterium]|nr:hypothetical protein [Anaerolineales bacterium]
MNALDQLQPNELAVMVTPRAEEGKMLELTALLALRGRVGVLDGGNSFDAYQIARFLRRRTAQLTETLSRIHVARVFTCYQMLTLLEETPASNIPQLILDFLATFYDESISAAESYRLLGVALGHLNRLRKSAPVIVSIHPPRVHQPDRERLVEALLDIADHVFIRETPRPDPPARLL